MSTALWILAELASQRPTPTTSRRKLCDRGEGVISAAIAVLVVACVGALMWFGFQRMWERTETKTNEQIEQIGT